MPEIIANPEKRVFQGCVQSPHTTNKVVSCATYCLRCGAIKYKSSTSTVPSCQDEKILETTVQTNRGQQIIKTLLAASK